MLSFSTACASSATKPPEGAAASTASDVAAGVENPALAALLEKQWEDYLRRNPVGATRLGDHRFDDRIGDRSLAAKEEWLRTQRALLDEAQRIRDAGQLSPRDSITLRLFIEEISTTIQTDSCLFEEWTVDPRSNPVTDWNDLPELHAVKTAKDAENLLARYSQISQAIDHDISHLTRGAKKQLYGNIESTNRVMTMVRKQLVQSLEDWPMYAPAKKPPEAWSDEEKKVFADNLRNTLVNSIKPALERYLVFLERDILPHSRRDNLPGLSALPFAKVCYQSLVSAYTTIETSPEELHKIGIAENERINNEMKVLGKKLFGTAELPEILKKLRTDPELYFSTSEEVEEKAKSALLAARAKIPQYFGILPKADCVVTRVPDYEAPYTTVAYYRQPVPDGSRPGQYFINVSEPATRPKFEAEALAFHEAVPGHHLQIAIAQELPAIPSFRRHGGMTVFVEGWALYTEQLAAEMGLYSGDLDKMGMLSYEAWRASRLVVDTGLHAMGWSRQAAKEYMAAHTALALNNIDNEVDRYINWPGQAVAYKTGQMEIWKLRREAEAELGSSFDIRAFHDVVLKNGAVSLPILRAEVTAWIAQSKRR